MNSINNSMSSKNSRRETVSRLLSSMGCSWDTNEKNCCDENSTTSSISIERTPARRVSFPSFSLTGNVDEEKENVEGKSYDSDCSSDRRDAVQSKASKLMSRKGVFYLCKEGEKDQQSQTPQRIMFENILDSFDQLVEARIRAYARILSNHVRVLSESNNMKGARIAEYKLQTLLEVAANHLLFDSISTEFLTSTSKKEFDVHDNDVNSAVSTDTTTTKDETNFSTPIELVVEIQSPRLFHDALEATNCDGVTSPTQRGHQGKLVFRAKGKLRGGSFVIGQNLNTSNDRDRCPAVDTKVCRNSKDSNRAHSTYNSFFENIDIEIDCETLLSQMMEEASKVVTMAVNLTNLAWTNNTEKQEEINNINMIADDSRKTANIIVDDDNSCTDGKHLPPRVAGKRPRSEDTQGTHTGNSMSKQVSDLSLHQPTRVVCEEEHTDDVPTSTVTATITNLHVLEQGVGSLKRYYDVSDPSHDSSSTGTTHDYQPEECPPKDEDDGDDCDNKITAERACDIVDIVLAGDIIPCHFSPNKKLRTK